MIKWLALAALLVRSKNSLETVITTHSAKALKNLDAFPVRRFVKCRKTIVSIGRPRTAALLSSLPGDKVIDDPGNTKRRYERGGAAAVGTGGAGVRLAGANLKWREGDGMSDAASFFERGFSRRRTTKIKRRRKIKAKFV